MKKTIFTIILILALQILTSCQFKFNTNTISQKYSETYDGPADYLPTTYSSEEKFLTWLDSQEKFDEKYRRLFAMDKVRFKAKKIPEGYNFSSISVQMNMVTYSYKKADEEVYMKFQYETIHYFDIDKESKSKTFEQTMKNDDKKIQKDNKVYYVMYPKTVNDDILRGHIIWNIDNYFCAIYTRGIKSYDDSIFDYCEFEKVPLK